MLLNMEKEQHHWLAKTVEGLDDRFGLVTFADFTLNSGRVTIIKDRLPYTYWSAYGVTDNTEGPWDILRADVNIDPDALAEVCLIDIDTLTENIEQFSSELMDSIKVLIVEAEPDASPESVALLLNHLGRPLHVNSMAKKLYIFKGRK